MPIRIRLNGEPRELSGAQPVTALLRAAGFTDVATRIDLGGQPRCTGGRASITG